MLADLLGIFNNDAAASDMELQILKNQESIRLRQKQSSSKISEIHAKYDVEKERIRSEINSLDEDVSSDEYQDLMAELNEIKDAEEREVETEENESSDFETELQVQNDNITSRLEALKADNESLKEMHQQNIESSFGYFK